MSISFKSIVLSLSLVMASVFSFAGSEVQPIETTNIVTVLPACTMSGSVSSGGITIEFDVTADTCGEAAAGIVAIAEALDEM